MTDDTETTMGGTPKPKKTEIVQARIDKIPVERQAQKSSDSWKGWAAVAIGTFFLGLRQFVVPEIPWWLGVVIMCYGFYSMDREWNDIGLSMFIARARDAISGWFSRGTPPASTP